MTFSRLAVQVQVQAAASPPPRLPGTLRPRLLRLVNPNLSSSFPRSFSSSSSSSNDIPPFYPLLPPSSSYPDKSPELAVDHLVIGAGVVGLAVARELSRRWPHKTTYLVERRKRWGEETSSRNSEVIHAGLYYPSSSLKTALCLQGRELLYAYCTRRSIPHRQVSKLVVGPSSSLSYFQNLVSHCISLQPRSLRPPVRLLNGQGARELEPDLSKDIGSALLSERTGIVSSHDLMQSLESEMVDSESSEVVYDTKVVAIRPSLPAGGGGGKRGGDASEEGWVVQTVTGGHGEDSTTTTSDALLAKVVINTSGLASNTLLNSMLRDGHFGSAPTEWATGGSGIGIEEKARREGKVPIGAWYCKGNYASYKGAGVERVKRLIYPTPDMGKAKGGGAHQGLGTHLTLDLSGNIRFGPDVEWLRPPALSSSSDSSDFWSSNLSALSPVPASSLQSSSSERLEAMAKSIRSYLPDIQTEGLSPDYAGIRPKLVPPGANFRDFGILWHESRDLERQRVWQELLSPSIGHEGEREGSGMGGYWDEEKGEWRLPGEGGGGGQAGGIGGGGGKRRGGAMMTLTGIESPGLTSSLALARLVGDAVGKRIWGDRGNYKDVDTDADGGDREGVEGRRSRSTRKMREKGDEAHDLDAWA